MVSALDAFPHARLPALWPEPGGTPSDQRLVARCSAVVLFLVLWRMTGELWPSALVAALFALHPLHVESVAWMAERRDVLSGLFFMLTLAAYGEYVRHPQSLGRYLAVVGFFALGLMSKSVLVTLPAALACCSTFGPWDDLAVRRPLAFSRARGRHRFPGASSRISCHWLHWPLPLPASPCSPTACAPIPCRCPSDWPMRPSRASPIWANSSFRWDFRLFMPIPKRAGPFGTSPPRWRSVGDHRGRGDWTPNVSLLLCRLVLVLRNAGSGARADPCGGACPRRPLHLPFADRAVHCAGLGSDAAGCLVAGPALGI